MPLNSILVALLIYAGLFNAWVLPAQNIGRNSFSTVLLSPQIYLFLASFFIIRFAQPLKLNIKAYFTHSIIKNILYGLAYASIIPFFSMFLLGAYSFLDYQKTGQWFIPWHGQSICPYTQMDYAFLFLLAPLSEEIFFRGLLFPALKQKYNLHIAVLFSALLFMSTHGTYHLGSLVLGVAMAYATHFHKSLWPAIIYHSVANAYIPIMCWFFPNALSFFDKFTVFFFSQ
ncbi:MAG TPA: type II CAAX endopeptidase family protein [Oligoflexia bacterium]|nr:type II CAAX endopeptidase family protein [Oligoflexia bacterium]HMR23887.1 type II CAAX endopeptidase family protein [Oligoflexia bacterium]